VVQLPDLLVQPRHRALHDDARGDLVDRQRAHRRRCFAELGQPGRQLLGRTHVHDAAQPNPGVRGGAHRAVLPRGEHGSGGALGGRHVRRRPAGQLELRVTGRVAQAVLPVAILGQESAIPGDQHRAEREVPGVDGLTR
jgi:hypothetical protein